MVTRSRRCRRPAPAGPARAATAAPARPFGPQPARRRSRRPPSGAPGGPPRPGGRAEGVGRRGQPVLEPLAEGPGQPGIDRQAPASVRPAAASQASPPEPGPRRSQGNRADGRGRPAGGAVPPGVTPPALGAPALWLGAADGRRGPSECAAGLLTRRPGPRPGAVSPDHSTMAVGSAPGSLSTWRRAVLAARAVDRAPGRWPRARPDTAASTVRHLTAARCACCGEVASARSSCTGPRDPDLLRCLDWLRPQALQAGARPPEESHRRQEPIFERRRSGAFGRTTTRRLGFDDLVPRPTPLRSPTATAGSIHRFL